MITVNYNKSVLSAQHNLTNATNSLTKTLERMSTGYKINHAKDDAAGLFISSNLATQIRGFKQAKLNTENAVSMITTAEGGLKNINTALVRMRELAVQGANGIYSTESRQAMQNEADQLLEQINQIQETTIFNGLKLLSGSASGGGSPSESVSPSDFITPVVKRDTTAMTTLASVSETDTISGGTYSISTAEELAKLATMVNSGKVTGGEFVLADNIDLSAYSSGSGWTPIGTWTNKFVAKFDGNGYTVSNLYIMDTIEDNQGLFGYVGAGSEIKNVGIVNCNVTGNKYVGGLVGYNYNGTIENCYITGSVASLEYTAYVGGLVGYNYNGTIKNSYANCSVQGRYTKQYVGGLAGCNSSGTIENCYATGDAFATG